MSAFHTEDELAFDLSQPEIDLVLSAFPPGASVEASHYFDNYDLPCPIRVAVRQPDGEAKLVVLRKARHGDVEREATVVGLLSEIGLPVPTALAGPHEGAVVLSLLEGEDLQHFSMRSESHVQRAKHLLLDALATLETITDKVAALSADTLLPRRSLIAELNEVSDDGPWSAEPLFQNSVSCLRPVLQQITTPMSFTNGDPSTSQLPDRWRASDWVPRLRSRAR